MSVLLLVGATSRWSARGRDVTPGRLPTRSVTSRCSWARSGQPAVVSATWTVTVPSGVDVAALVHAQVDQVVAELGVDDARAWRLEHRFLADRHRWLATASVYGRG